MGLALPKIGKFYKDQGVYQGIWEPRDLEGMTLGRVFHLFAAPKNLLGPDGQPLKASFNDAAICISESKNMYDLGHDGLVLDPVFYHEDLMSLVREYPKELSNFHIPPMEVLSGKNIEGKKIQSHNLWDHRDKMLEGSEFITIISDSDFAHCYFSCTEHREDASYVFDIDFTDGDGGWARKDVSRLSTRLVRALVI